MPRKVVEKLISIKDRSSYSAGSLLLENLEKDPFKTFEKWFKEAMNTDEANAMTLSTASLPSGRVSARMVLLKEVDNQGFVIYSNLETSRKSQDLRSNRWAALTFYWRALEKQVRIEGKIEYLSSEESQKYYDSRPLHSRLGAWASPQSVYLKDRRELEERFEEIKRKFLKELNHENTRIPIPPFWGGLRVVPESIEFWQGRENRLHDRFVYIKQESGWDIHRLAP
ncbi:pyridoxamine 5'-phosphate oxidase [Pneumocystis carinii B80]|uniref:pyridoxal 5'-phosphate synthase n=1 Tax=Pneumocystis carinii (strain B80) TaxID=1408658 RepID=A0A0W4ZCH8_PNEC8|nr:pyridoxamine 5'-phosphate oxidase [Pneumocystis carinii B80]KTW26127.1 pyridoxamine 5'-phosphate oxidase [Pneumocystis carinii B80]